jgi:hypothetical protein
VVHLLAHRPGRDGEVVEHAGQGVDAGGVRPGHVHDDRRRDARAVGQRDAAHPLVVAVDRDDGGPEPEHGACPLRRRGQVLRRQLRVVDVAGVGVQ